MGRIVLGVWILKVSAAYMAGDPWTGDWGRPTSSGDIGVPGGAPETGRRHRGSGLCTGERTILLRDALSVD